MRVGTQALNIERIYKVKSSYCSGDFDRKLSLELILPTVRRAIRCVAAFEAKSSTRNVTSRHGTSENPIALLSCVTDPKTCENFETTLRSGFRSRNGSRETPVSQA